MTRTAALCCLLVALVTLASSRPANAQGSPGLDPDFKSLTHFISMAADISLDPLERETLAEYAAEALRDAGGADAVRTCEAASRPSPDRTNPAWTRPLAITWGCARQASQRITIDGIALAVARRIDPAAIAFTRLPETPEGAIPYRQEPADHRPGEPRSSATSPAAIGVTIRKDPNGAATISWLPPQGPAARAGLRAGDRLVSVDGQPVEPMPIDGVIDALKGAVGSSVRIVWTAASDGTARQALVPREIIAPGPPLIERAAETIVVRIPRLTDATVTALKRELSSALALPDRPFAVLIDLRGSADGALTPAFEVAALFAGRGPGLNVVERRRTDRHRLRGRDITRGMPLYLLVDSTSISNAEVIAAILHDRGRARIVGERTSGLTAKSRTLIELENHGAVAIASGRFMRINGRPLSEGVLPDVVIDTTTPGPPYDRFDLGLERALEIVRAERRDRSAQ